MLYKPFVPDNVTNWRVFEGDEQIIEFLTNEENFRDLSIDDDEFQTILTEQEFEGSKDKYDTTTGRPKLHTMPKGVINLENMFDLRDKFKIPLNVKLVALV
jgi:hypothetical protein